MHQKNNKSRHQKGLFMRIFRPVKSTTHMLFKQNSLKR